MKLCGKTIDCEDCGKVAPVETSLKLVNRQTKESHMVCAACFEEKYKFNKAD